MAALVWKTRNWSVVRAELWRVCWRLRPDRIQRSRALIPCKYRLVTDEAKCGSMGRTRHSLRVYDGQEIGSRAGHGSHGRTRAAGVHCTCTHPAPLLLELAPSCHFVLFDCLSGDTRPRETRLCMAVKGLPSRLSRAYSYFSSTQAISRH